MPTGTAIHLGERDCSLQRRHQKILEETPSPAVTPELRRRLTEAALTLASAVGYRSAGTCEFLITERGEPAFLEMNTRLQVEHPVTEAVTGRDLVADQLRIAAGEPLGVDQADIHATGHAVEVRLYAEDAEDGFLPATGRIEALRWPAGDGIRVDAGIALGTEVGARFDPMLAKIVAHGGDRAEAFARLTRALDDTVVLGVVTNLRFLRWLVRQPVVLAGDARTDTLDRIWPPDDWAERTSLPEDAWRVAASMLAQAGEADPWATAGASMPSRPSGSRPATRPGPSPSRRPANRFESVVVGRRRPRRCRRSQRAVPARAATRRGSRGARGRVPPHRGWRRGRRGSDARCGPDRPCRRRGDRRGRRPDRHPRGDEDGARRRRADRSGVSTDIDVRPADQVVRGQRLATIES